MEEEFIEYVLPAERIAAWPAARRCGARDRAHLLHAVASKFQTVEISDRVVADLPQVLRRGDLLVLNQSRVLANRFYGKLADTGGEVEVLLLEPLLSTAGEELCFLAVANPMRKLRPGRIVMLTEDLECLSLERTDDGERLEVIVRRRESARDRSTPLSELIEKQGYLPIPPYIRRGRSEKADRELYQTVYSAVPGSIAAPTAGLHFTTALLEALASIGVTVSYLTLHVGAMSILPPREGAVGSEYFEIPEETERALRAAKEAGRRIVAVGTTVVRALESYALAPEQASGRSSLFIRPGFSFQLVDALMTNFHQPSSTHLHLVNAFFGSKRVRSVYEHALARDYLFLSYGDSMFLEFEGRDVA